MGEGCAGLGGDAPESRMPAAGERHAGDRCRNVPAAGCSPNWDLHPDFDRTMPEARGPKPGVLGTTHVGEARFGVHSYGEGSLLVTVPTTSSAAAGALNPQPDESCDGAHGDQAPADSGHHASPIRTALPAVVGVQSDVPVSGSRPPLRTNPVCSVCDLVYPTSSGLPGQGGGPDR